MSGDFSGGNDDTERTGGEENPQANELREAFELLGHEIRLDILLALLEDWVAAYTEPKSYAELMDAVEMEDSGKFNYHLDQLLGVYVQKEEEGYVPTASATALYRAVLGTRPTETFEIDGKEVGIICPACATAAEMTYEGGFVTVDCPACSEWAGFTYPFPQNGFQSHGEAAVPEMLFRRIRHDLALVRTGQCPDCAGKTTVDLRLDALDEGDHWVELRCETCSLVLGTAILPAVVTDDRVAAALRRIGVDPTRYHWELPPADLAIESTDPARISVTVGGTDGDVVVAVDDELLVRDVDVE